MYDRFVVGKGLVDPWALPLLPRMLALHGRNCPDHNALEDPQADYEKQNLCKKEQLRKLILNFGQGFLLIPHELIKPSKPSEIEH